MRVDRPLRPSHHLACLGGDLVDTISVIAHFASSHDVLVGELRIELLHPAYAHAEAVLMRLAEGPSDLQR